MEIQIVKNFLIRLYGHACRFGLNKIQVSLAIDRNGSKVGQFQVTDLHRTATTDGLSVSNPNSIPREIKLARGAGKYNGK